MQQVKQGRRTARFHFKRSSFHVVADGDGAVPLDPDVIAQACDAPLKFLHVLGGNFFAIFKSTYGIHGCNCCLERVSSLLGRFLELIRETRSFVSDDFPRMSDWHLLERRYQVVNNDFPRRSEWHRLERQGNTKHSAVLFIRVGLGQKV